jgi:hypothetical protein
LRPAPFDRPGGDLVSQPSIELLRAVITTHIDAAELGKESLHATLVVRPGLKLTAQTCRMTSAGVATP